MSTQTLNQPIDRAMMLLGHRVYIKGGMDSLYSDPEVRDLFVKNLLQGSGGMGYFSAQERAEVASEFLRGWVTHRKHEPVDALSWHRLIGTHHLVVSRA